MDTAQFQELKEALCCIKNSASGGTTTNDRIYLGEVEICESDCGNFIGVNEVSDVDNTTSGTPVSYANSYQLIRSDGINIANSNLSGTGGNLSESNGIIYRVSFGAASTFSISGFDIATAAPIPTVNVPFSGGSVTSGFISAADFNPITGDLWVGINVGGATPTAVHSINFNNRNFPLIDSLIFLTLL